jgi:pimeloyl-ACP methyl ester carboxylesterase
VSHLWSHSNSVSQTGSAVTRSTIITRTGMSARPLRINLADGPKFHLQEWGGGKHACFLIHGFGEGSYVWSEFALLAASHYHTFAIDLRGHGDSDWDQNGDYDVGTHVADMVQIIRTLGRTRLALVGHSMGADIAIRVAIECRENILGLVVVDFGPSLNPAGVQHMRAQFRAADQIYRSVADYAMWLAERRPLVRPGLLDRIAGCALRPRSDGAFQRKVDPSMIRPVNDQEDFSGAKSDLWALLSKMTWPVLLVRGEGSAVLTRDAATQVLEVLPDGHFRSVRFAGHDVMSDNPAGFADAVLPFLLHCSRAHDPSA